MPSPPHDDPHDDPPGDPPDGPPDPDAAFHSALLAELARKTGVCWLRYDGRTHPVWHVWSDEALCLVAGGAEQPLPDLADGARVEVVMRSKDDGGRLLTWVGRAVVVRPDDQAWGPTTTALVAGRLNLPDLAGAADAWARDSVVRRVLPTGEVTETPGSLPDGAQRVPTRGPTRGPGGP